MEQQSTSIFEMLIWAGAATSVIGLIGIVWCIVRVARARSKDLNDDELRVILQSVLPMNLGALFMSTLGLIMIGMGIALS